jgi:hypothetical protein
MNTCLSRVVDLTWNASARVRAPQDILAAEQAESAASTATSVPTVAPAPEVPALSVVFDFASPGAQARAQAALVQDGAQFFQAAVTMASTTPRSTGRKQWDRVSTGRVSLLQVAPTTDSPTLSATPEISSSRVSPMTVEAATAATPRSEGRRRWSVRMSQSAPRPSLLDRSLVFSPSTAGANVSPVVIKPVASSPMATEPTTTASASLSVEDELMAELNARVQKRAAGTYCMLVCECVCYCDGIVTRTWKSCMANWR